MNKVAIVTGGANGIGKQIVFDLLEVGYKVAVIDKEDKPVDNTFFVHGDIKDKNSLEEFYQAVISEFGRVDVLVNNACYGKGGILTYATYEDFDEVLAVGLKAPYYLSLLCKDELVKNKGRIINIASSRWNQSEPDSEAYASTKGGIVALTHALAMSLGPDVLVNAIAPGWIKTSDYEISKLDRLAIPAGKVGVPKNISSAVMFLINQDFITGETLVIDGGMSKRMIYHDSWGWKYDDQS